MDLLTHIIIAAVITTLAVASAGASIVLGSLGLLVAAVLLGVIAIGVNVSAKRRWDDAEPEKVWSEAERDSTPTAPYPATTPCPEWCDGKHENGVNDWQDAVHESAPMSTYVTNPDDKQGDTFTVFVDEYPEHGETLTHVELKRSGKHFDTHMTLTYAEALALSVLLDGAAQKIIPPEVRNGEAILETVPA